MSLIEDQIREIYGRVIYTHKTHEVCADILESRNECIKNFQIALSAVTTVGFLGFLFSDDGWLPIMGAIVSMILLGLNLYTREFDLSRRAALHRNTASQIWDIRESYLSLLTDLNTSGFSATAIRERRDDLQIRLNDVYANAPSTNSKAYIKAQFRLKKSEDMTFSTKEIDAFLPKALKRAK